MSNRKIKRILLKQLDFIYNRSKIIAYEFSEDKIPLTMFKTVCDTAKLSPEKKEVKRDPKLKPLIDAFNKTCDLIHKTAEDNAKMFGNKSVKLGYVKTLVDHTKKSFKEGVSGG